MITCPNKSSKEWKDLVNIHGTSTSYLIWNQFEGNVPSEYYNKSNYSNKVVYQNNTSQSDKDYIASEKTIRDLAERIADRIGLEVRYESDRTKDYKGKLEGDTAVINLAHATLDTPIHEILGHPIIRAIKQNLNYSTANFKVVKSKDDYLVQILEKDGWRSERLANLEKRFKTKEEAESYKNKLLQSDNQLYKNLLKELETGKGKEVLDRVKRDYKYKTDYFIIKDDSWGDIEYSVVKHKDVVAGGNTFKTRKEAEQRLKELSKEYTLEEQQEEAIVELLGLYTANRLDKVKDGKLISLLKRLLKEMKAYMKSLFNAKEVEIDKLPDNMTLGDMADLLAYSNSKLILPGNEVIYTTPDNKRFKTYQEASNHVSALIKTAKDIDLSSIKINIPTVIGKVDPITNKVIKRAKFIEGTESEFIPEENQYEPGTPGYYELLFEDNTENTVTEDDLSYNYDEAINEFYSQIRPYSNTISSFIKKNKEYEQAKNVIEEWKKINDIKYNPEEIYSRGQGFYSVVGAYSDFDVKLMFQNLLAHIEDNQKAGGEFTISAFTKPIDRNIGHLEGGGGKIKFKIYPKSKDIKWAANTDVFSGSVWDAGNKINKDKASELLGVSYSKYPGIFNLISVQPNLADIVEGLAYHHNELGIELNSNFRLEYDKNVPFSTKKLINSINSILDNKYGKLIEPKIQVIEKNEISYYRISYDDIIDKRFKTLDEAKAYVDNNKEEFQIHLGTTLDYSDIKAIKPVGIKPNKTKDDIKIGFNEVMANLGIDPITKESNKDYTEQALINIKIAALKEANKKYPRSLIRSEVRPINNSIQEDLFASDELPFQKVSKFRINIEPNTIVKDIFKDNLIDVNSSDIINNLLESGYISKDHPLHEMANKLKMESFEVKVSDNFNSFIAERPNLKNAYMWIENGHRIHVSKEKLDNTDKETFITGFLHEVVHGYTRFEYYVNDEFKNEINEIYSDFLKLSSDTTLYGFTDVEEFIAELMSNPAFQDKIEPSLFRRWVNAILKLINSKYRLRSPLYKKAYNTVAQVIEHTNYEGAKSRIPFKDLRTYAVIKDGWSQEKQDTVSDGIIYKIKQFKANAEANGGIVTPDKVFKQTKEFFFKYAFSTVKGDSVFPIGDKHMRNLNELLDKKDWVGYATYLASNNIQSRSFYGEGDAQKKLLHNLYFDIARSWDQSKDNLGNDIDGAGWREIVRLDLRGHGYKITIKEEDIEQVDEDNPIQKIYNMTHFESSLKDKLSGEVRAFMTGLTYDRNNIMGFPIPVEFDTLYAQTALALVVNNTRGIDTSTIEGMLLALEDMGTYYEEAKILYDALMREKKTNPKLMAGFKGAFNNIYTHFLSIHQKLVKDKESGDYNMLYQLFDSNQKGVQKRVKTIARGNVIDKTGGNKRALYRVDPETGDLSIKDINRVEDLMKLYNSLSSGYKAEGIEQFDDLSQFLGLVGIDITAEELKDYITITGQQLGNNWILGEDLWDYLISGIGSEDKKVSLFNVIKTLAIPEIGKIGEERGKITGYKQKTIPGDIYETGPSKKALDRFIDIKSLYDTNHYGSFMTSMGKNIYPVNLPTHLDDTFMSIKNGKYAEETVTVKNPHTDIEEEVNLRLIFPLYNPTDDVFGVGESTGMHMDYMYKTLFKGRDGGFHSEIQWADFESFKLKQEILSKLDYETRDETVAAAIRYNFFINNGNLKTAFFPVPVQADRSRETVYSFPRLSNDDYLSKEDKDFKKIIRDYLIQDIQAIQQAHEQVDEGENQWPEEDLLVTYHYDKNSKDKRDKSGQTFKLRQIYGIESDILTNISNYTNEEVLSELENKVEEIYQRVTVTNVDKEFDRLVGLGVIKYENGNFKTWNNRDALKFDTVDTMLDKMSIIKLGFKTGNKRTDIMDSFKKFIGDYVRNEFVTKTSMFKLLRVDRAFSPTAEDVNKRFGHITTPGTHILQKGELEEYPDYGMPKEMRNSIIYDVINKDADPNIKSSLSTVLRLQGNTKAANIIDKVYEPGKSNKTDATGVMNLIFTKGYMEGMSQWTDEHEEAFQNYYNNPELTKENGYRTFRTNKGIAPPLIPLKLSYDRVVYHYGIPVPMIIKNSYHTLLEEYAIKHPVVHKLLLKMEKQGVDTVNTITTTKLARSGMVDINSEDYTLNVSILPTDYLRTTQVIPNKDENPRIAAQLWKNMLSNIPDGIEYNIQIGEGKNSVLNSTEVVKLFTDVYKALLENSEAELLEEMKYKPNRNKAQQLAHLQALRRVLQTPIEDRDLSDDFKKALNIKETVDGKNYTFVVPLAMPGLQRRFEQTMASLWKNNVLSQRTNGTTAVQIAELGSNVSINGDKGLKFVTAETIEISSKDIKRQDLKEGMVIEHEGKPYNVVKIKGDVVYISRILHAEVAMKSSLAKAFGIKSGEDVSKIPEELRRIIGYRIPNQGKASGLPMIIKYFLPESYSHAILVPGEITTQQGSDFDIDKLFIMMPNIKGVKEAVIDYLKSADTNNELLNESGYKSYKELLKLNPIYKEFYKNRIKQEFTNDTEFTDLIQDDLIKLRIDEGIRNFFDSGEKIQKEQFDYTNLDYNAIKSQSREALENALLDITEAIYLNPAHIAEVTTPIDDPTLGLQAEYLKEALGIDASIDYSAPDSEEIFEARNKVGGRLISIYATSSSAYKIGQHLPNYRAAKLAPIINGKTYNKLNVVKNIDGGFITEDFDAHVNIAVDNANKPIAFFINDSDITSPVTNWLLNTGLGKDIPTWLNNQPIVREVVETYKKKRMTPDRMLDLVDTIGKKYDREFTIKNTIYDMTPVITKNDKGEYTEMSGVSEPIKGNSVNQVHILSNFYNFHKAGRLLGKVNKVLMPDRIGNMSTVSNMQEYFDIVEHVTNQNIIEGVINKPTGEILFPLAQDFMNVLRHTTDFLNEYFPWSKPAIVNMKSYLKDELGLEKFSAKIHDAINTDIFLYIMQQEESPLVKLGYFDQAVINKLMFDPEDNIVTEWTTINKKYGERLKDNKFFKRLFNHPNNKDVDEKVYRLKFDNDFDFKRNERNHIGADFLKLSTASESYKDRFTVQEAEEIEDFMENLVIYSLNNTGFMVGPDTFTDIIPLQEWQSLGMISFFEKELNNLNQPEYLHDFAWKFVANSLELEGLIRTISHKGKEGLFDKSGTIITFNANDARILKETTKGEKQLLTVIKMKNGSKGEFDYYQLYETGNSTVSYKKALRKGEPNRFKEYNVYSYDGQERKLILPSIHPNNKITGDVFGSTKVPDTYSMVSKDYWKDKMDKICITIPGV